MVVLSTLAAEMDRHYYYQNQPVGLILETNQLAVSFTQPQPAWQSETFLRRLLGNDYRDSEPLFKPEQRLVNLDRVLSENELGQLIDRLNLEADVRMVSPVYRFQQTLVVVTDEFMVRFKAAADPTVIEQFNRQHGVKMIKSLAGNTYVLAVDKRSGLNGLSAANIYHALDWTEWASPNFIYPRGQILNATVNDPLWPQQWAHRNIGQSVATGAAEGDPGQVQGYEDADMDVDLAWDALIAAGKTAGGSPDILVAIIDSGIDLDHPDLAPNIPDPGIDFTSDGTSDDLQGHGTAVAGIVAAVGDNGQGVAGIAYQSKLLPVKFYSMWASAPDDAIAQAIDYAWQNGAHVLNNSWGGTAPNQGVTEAIQRAKTQGRDGLGCVILFSSGNEGRGRVNYPAYLNEVIAVGASTMFDEKKNPGSQDYLRKWGGNYGSALDVVAPTTVYTTDVVGPTGGGLPGFKNGDYNDTFSGTSAACPNATGVAALVLAANPNLNSDQVQNILRQSADKIELYPYDTNGWNQHVGYGRVNAHKAVLLALGEDGDNPLIAMQPLKETSQIGSRTVLAEINDGSGIATGPAQPRLYYRTLFDGDTSQWNYVVDEDGPAGSEYEFVIPAVSWGTQVEYYVAAQDNSIYNHINTFPFGGGGINPPGTQPPPRLLRYFVADFDSTTYISSDVPISWTNYQGHTSNLTINDAHTIVDLNATIHVSGFIEDFAINLEGPWGSGAGITMLNPGEEYLNTTFDDEATIAITDGSSPYSGSYIPDNALLVFDGKNSAGTWTLRVYDDLYYNNGGTIHDWNVQIKYMLPVKPPLVSDIPGQTIDEGNSFGPVYLDNYVTDPDHSAQEMIWSASGQIDLIVTIDPNTRIATIETPHADWYGQETITFTATDPTLLKDSDQAVFTVTNINDAPLVSGIPDQEIYEGESFEPIHLDHYVSDVDNDPEEMTWSYAGNGELSVNIDTNTRIVAIAIPHNQWHGSETIVFTATDPGGLADSDTATFTVIGVNDPPFVSGIPDQNILTGGHFEPIVLDNYVTDPDHGPEEMTWSYSGNQELLVRIDSNRIARVDVPDESWSGSESIIFTATDPGGLSDSDTALFVVTPQNGAPLVTDIPDQTIYAGENFRSIPLDEYVYDADNSPQEMTWTYGGNQDLIVEIDSGRMASITVPDDQWVGQEHIYFTATDPGGLSASDTATFTVLAVNQGPQIITPLPDLTFAEDDSLVYAVSGWYDYVVDPDDADSTLHYQIVDDQRFVKARKSGASYVFTAPADWFGTDTLQLVVRDAEYEDRASFQVIVRPVNDPPQIINLPDSIVFNNTGTYLLSLIEFEYDVDTPSEKLSWAVNASDTVLKIEYNAGAKTALLSATDYIGEVQLDLTLTDDSTASAHDSIPVRIKGSTAITFDPQANRPREFMLDQNYPNPFNPRTTIGYALPAESTVYLSVFNIRGQEVAVLLNRRQPAGYHTVVFDAGPLSSGLYFYRLQATTSESPAERFNAMKKLILLR